MRRTIKRLFGIPVVNALVRRIVKFFAAGSKSLSSWLIRRIHVSGNVRVVIQNNSIRLWAAGDDALASKLYYGNDWEEHVIFWFAAFCGGRNSVIDAGANIGIYSIVAGKANAEAVIHAFEPNPYNAARLKKNVALNDLATRIHVHEVALGNETARLAFHFPVDPLVSDVSSVYRSHTESFNDFEHREAFVHCTTLDRFCSEAGFVPRIIKIDVELYELQVLMGMELLLKSARPYIFCEIFNDEVKRKLNPALNRDLESGYTARLQQFLESMGYYFYLIVPSGILLVDSFTLSPLSSMYILLPIKLNSSFYLPAEVNLVLSALDRD